MKKEQLHGTLAAWFFAACFGGPGFLVILPAISGWNSDESTQPLILTALAVPFCAIGLEFGIAGLMNLFRPLGSRFGESFRTVLGITACSGMVLSAAAVAAAPLLVKLFVPQPTEFVSYHSDAGPFARAVCTVAAIGFAWGLWLTIRTTTAGVDGVGDE